MTLMDEPERMMNTSESRWLSMKLLSTPVTDSSLPTRYGYSSMTKMYLSPPNRECMTSRMFSNSITGAFFTPSTIDDRRRMLVL